MKLGYFFVSNVYQVEANLKVAYSSLIPYRCHNAPYFILYINIRGLYFGCLNSILSTLLSLYFLIIIAYSIRYSVIYLHFSVSSLVHSYYWHQKSH